LVAVASPSSKESFLLDLNDDLGLRQARLQTLILAPQLGDLFRLRIDFRPTPLWS